MNNFKISSSDGQCLEFQGSMIASVRSSRLATPRGDVWFELNAYEHENQHWVTTIATKGSGCADDGVVDFCCSTTQADAEDLLYDFDPMRCLRSDVSASGLPEAAVDRAYCAAVRSLTAQMKSHEQRSLTTLNVLKRPAHEHAGWVEEWMVNRIRDWLHT